MIQIFCDGGCIVGKGIGAYSYVIEKDGKILKMGSAAINRPGLTNNQAEYSAIIHAVSIAGALPATIVSDSEVAIKQINGIYRVTDETLKKQYNIVMWSSKYGNFKFINAPRENKYIQIADKMNKIIMNEMKEKQPRMDDWSDGDRCR